MTNIRTLPYLGGKSNFSGAGSWIASLLNNFKTDTYVEPFSGMLGVLTRRQRSDVEIANDLDKRVITYWEVLQEQPQDFLDVLEFTALHSRNEFDKQKELLDSNDPVKVAVAVFIVLRNTIPATLYGDFTRVGSRSKWNLPDDVYRINERIRYVCLECTDAVQLLHRYIDYSNSLLVYCDPPYPNTKTYQHSVSHSDLIEVLLKVAHKSTTTVAVSGYDGDYVELEQQGWQVHHLRFREQISRTSSSRVETLWVSTAIENNDLFSSLDV